VTNIDGAHQALVSTKATVPTTHGDGAARERRIPFRHNECEPDQRNDDHTRSGELTRTCHESFFRVVAPKDEGHAKDVSGRNEGQTEPFKPRGVLSVGNEGFHDGNRNTDAPHRVKSKDALRHLDAHPECGDVGRTAEVIVAGVRRVPQKLIGGALFDQRVRHSQQHHRGPTAPPPTDLTNKEGTTAVERSQEECEAYLSDSDIPKQELADERGQQ
jgi:hypothetical protein